MYRGSVKIVDCTFRDGGHLNKWNFDNQCVIDSYIASSKSGVDYFEIGYRTPNSIQGLGQYAYCTDEFLLNLIEPTDNCKLTIMIDAGKSDIKINHRRHSPIKAIRVASYPYELEKAIELVHKIKDKGYEVFLNLMAFSEFTEKEFKILEDWKSKNILEAIYFADSFGSLTPYDVEDKIFSLQNIGFEKIGFHAHNNLQLAFANTLIALDTDASYIDASIYGMGRGSGNLQIEVLLAYLERSQDCPRDKYNPVHYINIIDQYFIDIYKQYNWGYNLQSLMGGIKNIHPYYISNLFEKDLNVEQIWHCLDDIKEHCPISFSAEKLNEILEQRTLIKEEDKILEYIKNI